MAVFQHSARFRLPPAFPLTLLLLPLLVAGEIHATESSRGYRMYRNPPKPRLAVLSAAGTLDSAARSALDAAILGEAKALKDLSIVSLPSAHASTTAHRPDAATLAGLGRRHAVDLVLHARADREGDSLVLDAAVLDTRTGFVRTSLRSACLCALDSLTAAAREGVRSLSRAPSMRAFRCDERMAFIPSLPSGSGAADRASGKAPARGFCIDLYEFPNLAFGEPVTGRTWNEAEALCAEQGKRLCSEDEWTLACGGWEGRAYPYGNAYDPERCNTRSRTIRLSGSDAGCAGPFGARDLSGNVYEWTSTRWSTRHADRVVKGGNWSAGAENSTCAVRFGQSPSAASRAIGFRCCLTLEDLGPGGSAEAVEGSAPLPQRGGRRR